MHEMFKPQDGMKTLPRKTQDNETRKDNHSSLLTDTLHNSDNPSCHYSKEEAEKHVKYQLNIKNYHNKMIKNNF